MLGGEDPCGMVAEQEGMAELGLGVLSTFGRSWEKMGDRGLGIVGDPIWLGLG